MQAGAGAMPRRNAIGRPASGRELSPERIGRLLLGLVAPGGRRRAPGAPGGRGGRGGVPAPRPGSGVKDS